MDGSFKDYKKYWTSKIASSLLIILEPIIFNTMLHKLQGLKRSCKVLKNYIGSIYKMKNPSKFHTMLPLFEKCKQLY